ncbi:hypothetical protein [Thalassococcus sp. S3]|uniref:hypothetical protein n=1 Tax=Thalassococcus sp. S3 TaxID=2017482 RepID=UPI00102B7D86|nr:hypothetical protein [Thalassococcus sp. S3]
MWRQLILAALLSCLWASDADAKEFLVDGKCELIVASRKSIAEAQDYIQANMNPNENTRIFLSQNGWYAVSIGSLWPEERDAVMENWKSTGRIPEKSFCSSGKRFLEAYAWDTGAAWQNPRYADTTPQETRPQACRSTRQYCVQFAAKALACGFGTQKAANYTFGENTGPLGSGAAGAACAKLLAEADNLNIDAIDLALAAGGSVALTESGRMMREGDFLGALFGLAVAGSANIAGIQRCEASLQRACR